MGSITVSVNKIKNITTCSFELSFSKGIYALVGENGCGKSTLMSILALLVKPSTIKTFRAADYKEDSKILLTVKNICDECSCEDDILTVKGAPKGGHRMKNHYRGFYEGSIFYGTRFYDFSIIKNVLQHEDLQSDLMPVDNFVKDNLSKILHGDKTHYRNLQKIRTKKIAAQKYKLAGVPYFFDSDGNLISQYSMSSGECMLISLIDFVNNLLRFAKMPKGAKVLFLIDEVELALHPAAIDRLIVFFEHLIRTSRYEIVVYFSTHSSEVIQKIPPKNLYLLENHEGTLECINPCYANYAIRNLYVPNGFDFLILVEDNLAKKLVEKVIRDNNLSSSKLVCVLPGGGWSQLLKLHSDIVEYNALGVGKKIISVYDGDVRIDVLNKKEYSRLPKIFLPVSSIEKFLRNKLFLTPDNDFIKLIGDKYFNQTRITDIIKAYRGKRSAGDSSGKLLYKTLVKELQLNGITEDDFIKYLCDDIYDYETTSISNFIATLSSAMK